MGAEIKTIPIIKHLVDKFTYVIYSKKGEGFVYWDGARFKYGLPLRGKRLTGVQLESNIRMAFEQIKDISIKRLIDLEGQ
jgi:hypothetical protein